MVSVIPIYIWDLFNGKIGYMQTNTIHIPLLTDNTNNNNNNDGVDPLSKCSYNFQDSLNRILLAWFRFGFHCWWQVL